MKTVWVTGADRGVGYALCERFIEGGWHVLAGQFMPDWPQLAALKERYPEQLDVLPLDVGSTTSVEQAAAQTMKLCDHVDLLVSCAGISGGDDEAKTRAIYNVNVLGALRMVEHFLPLMQTGLKRLAFVSSEAGSVSVANRDGGFA